MVVVSDEPIANPALHERPNRPVVDRQLDVLGNVVYFRISLRDPLDLSTFVIPMLVQP